MGLLIEEKNPSPIETLKANTFKVKKVVMKIAPSWFPNRTPTVLTPPNTIGASISRRRSARIVDKATEKDPTYELELVEISKDNFEKVAK